ncbi:Lactate utilization protein C [Vibrio aerogenes CECT 7868]|uniref:Lactate utilization protein C n=1 Tax=Vibrio aerogenes CECT 7868 TaxID=1216006 RepID=A0A1M5YHG3_9VIBR|nr:lactate utilization protein C [Vibrio aerogenes]SHI11465.1 Lactate utilization protein C [Vibrio aerogenes CECT 7868]
MNTAKDNILARLRSAGAVPVHSESYSSSSWGEMYQVEKNEMVDHFRQALTENHAQVSVIELSELQETLQKLCQDKGWRRAVTGNAGAYLETIRQGLFAIEVTALEQPFERWKSELFHDVDVGITHAAAGIADTGALVLKSGSAEPRTLSLVPPCHVAVLRQSDLFASLSQVMVQQQWSEEMPTNLLLISGPSKTADIQRTLAYGAHGPAELVVIILSDQ